MASESIDKRVADTVKTDATEVDTKPLNVEKYKAIASQSDSDKTKALEENVIEEKEEESKAK